MKHGWRCQKCNKPLNIKCDLDKPRKIKCRRCGRENIIQKGENGKFGIS